MIEERTQFGHEQLAVYRLAIDYVAWAYTLAKELSGVDSHARDQLLRAAQSIPLNIAEGNGKGRDSGQTSPRRQIRNANNNMQADAQNSALLMLGALTIAEGNGRHVQATGRTRVSGD